MIDSPRHDVRSALLRFFELAARKDRRVLARLRRHGFAITASAWDFGLVELHGFLQQTDPLFREISYESFRALLFRSPVNQTIGPIGAQIVIGDNQHNVDRSRYALVWR